MLSSPASPTIGVQQPRILAVPAYGRSIGQEAIELAALAGLNLDPWQQLVLAHSLGKHPGDGKWAAREVGLCVPRQNGKGSILEARELAGLFLLGERLIIHSAHEFATSAEHFKRLEELIAGTPELSRRVKPRGVKRSHGEEGIELRGGQRIRFKTRTKGGGRGFTGDLVVLDEAMILSEASYGALLPTMSALSVRGNPQVWLTGSAVDQAVHDHGLVFATVRKRGLAGDDPELLYCEWSAPGELQDAHDIAGDEDAWAQANPGLGIRISTGHVAFEKRSMPARAFAVERLGIGDWPDPDALVEEGRLTPEMWKACEDPRSSIVGAPIFSVDVRPDRSWAAIGAAGRRADGDWHGETVDHRQGTGWVAERLAGLVARHRGGKVFIDGGGPAASLLPALAELKVEVEVIGAKEHAQACGALYDDCDQQRFHHIGTPELAAAVHGAKRRPLGDAWAWSRKDSTVDISPLVAVTLALHGARSTQPAGPPRLINLAEV